MSLPAAGSSKLAAWHLPSYTKSHKDSIQYNLVKEWSEVEVFSLQKVTQD